MNCQVSTSECVCGYSMKDRPKMKDFLLTIVLEGLEGKYDVHLSRGNVSGWLHLADTKERALFSCC